MSVGERLGGECERDAAVGEAAARADGRGDPARLGELAVGGAGTAALTQAENLKIGGKSQQEAPDADPA